MKLNIDCAAIITDDVQQKHHLLQAIKAHREQFPDFAKVTLEKIFSKMSIICEIMSYDWLTGQFAQ